MKKIQLIKDHEGSYSSIADEAAKGMLAFERTGEGEHERT